MASEQSMDLVTAIDETATWIEESKADGKFDGSDFFKAISLAPAFQKAVSGIQNVPTEWQGMSDEEKDTLIAAFGIALRRLLEAPFK